MGCHLNYLLTTLKRQCESFWATACRLKIREVNEFSRLPETSIYVDDTDFITFCQDYLDEVIEVVVPLFKDEYKLIVNADI